MDLRIPALGAVVGFVLSFLGGLFGGVGFPDILLRALLWSLVLGVLAAGAILLLRKVVPELFELRAGSEADEEASGPRVDIVMPSEVPEDAVFDARDRGFPLRDFEEGGELPEVGASPADAWTGQNSGPGAEGALPEAEDEGLPDMSAFAKSFQGEPEPESASGPVSSGEGGQTFVEFDGQQEDPAFLAKAVQTVLKKGSKG